MALKIGSEDKKKVAIAGVLAVIVIALGWNVFSSYFGGETTPPPEAPAQVVSTTGAPSHEAAVKTGASMASLDPTLHPEWMAAAESLRYTGAGRNIFSMSSAPEQMEQAKGPVRPSAAAAAAMQPQGPPPPPPIDLKFFGYESKQGVKRAFLLHGDDVYIASEGDVVDHRYKVVSIQPFSIQINDLPFNNTQSLPLIQN